jgi:hypothetical protein
MDAEARVIKKRRPQSEYARKFMSRIGKVRSRSL